MRKLKLLTVTGLILAGISGQTLTAQAANVVHNQPLPNGGRVIVSYAPNCNIQNIQGIFEQLENCFPGITVPDCNFPNFDLPDCTPDTDAPDSIPDATPDQTPENTPDNVPDSTPDNAPGVTPDFTPDETPEETPEELPEAEHAFIKEVVNLVNIERAKEGLSPLTIDTKVQSAAMVRAKECEQSFSHTRPNGSSFATALKEQNVSYTRVGENIAWGQRSPKEVMTAWMNSSGHRANIMNPNFTTIGVGYYENSKGTDYWCQLFTR